MIQGDSQTKNRNNKIFKGAKKVEEFYKLISKDLVVFDEGQIRFEIKFKLF
jgi:hypothetical protein